MTKLALGNPRGWVGAGVGGGRAIDGGIFRVAKNLGTAPGWAGKRRLSTIFDLEGGEKWWKGCHMSQNKTVRDMQGAGGGHPTGDGTGQSGNFKTWGHYPGQQYTCYRVSKKWHRRLGNVGPNRVFFRKKVSERGPMIV